MANKQRSADRQNGRPRAVTALLRLVGYGLIAATAGRRARRPADDELPDAPVERRQVAPPKTERGIWPLAKETFTRWSNHKASRLGAALAYYSVFSLGPLLVVVVAIAGLVFGDEAVRGELTGQLRGLLGETGAQGIEAMLDGASKPS